MRGVVTVLTVADQTSVRVFPGQTAVEVEQMMDVERDLIAAGLGAILGLTPPAIPLEDFKSSALPASIFKKPRVRGRASFVHATVEYTPRVP